MTTPSFSEIVKYRSEQVRLKTIAVKHDLIGRHGNIAPVLQRHMELRGQKGPLKVLDVGAYDRAFGSSLKKCGLACTYQSVDVDGSIAHDFREMRDVNGSYDVIGMFELIEHLTFEQVDELLHDAFRLLSAEGRLFISTPNPFHPTRYFSDVSHKQHWPPGDLYGLLRHVGFKENRIELYGVIYKSGAFGRSTLESIRNLLWRVIGIERKGGILAIAVKD